MSHPARFGGDAFMPEQDQDLDPESDIIFVFAPIIHIVFSAGQCTATVVNDPSCTATDPDPDRAYKRVCVMAMRKYADYLEVTDADPDDGPNYNN